jgi:hypothetical protein
MRQVVYDEYQENPMNVMQMTFDNRDIALKKLANIGLTFYPSPRPGELTITARKKGELVPVDAYKNWDGDPFILFSEPLEVPVGQYMCRINGAQFFSDNAKMASISFGIPAGPESVNGACPSSALPDSYQKHYALGDVDQRPMKYDDQICRKCYANKGNMAYELQQLYQVVRFRWIKEQLAKGMTPGQLGELFTAAVGTASENPVRRRPSSKENPLFVRLHDSGDLFDMDYWRAWKIACLNLPNLNWWCPTRMWMIPAYTQLFQRDPKAPDLPGVPENLALRPSAYHFNEKAPVIPGMAAGSTSHYWESKKGGLKVDPILSGIADWKCPAYEEVEGVKGTSCKGALERVRKVWVSGPHGEAFQRLEREMTPEERALTNNCTDCRVCWLKPNWRVSYAAH